MTDLVADGDEDDFGSGIKRKDIGVDPLSGGVGIGGERRNVAVSSADDDTNPCSGQSFDDGGIGAVESNFLDRSGLEELGGF